MSGMSSRKAQSPVSKPESIPILGIPVSPLSMDETVDHLDLLIQEGRPNLVATADSSGLVIAREDEELAAIYRSASLVTCDSYGVVWAMKRKGKTVERVSGCDLCGRLFELSAEKGYRIYMLGGAPGVAAAAAENIRLKHIGCQIVGIHNGFFPASEDILVATDVAKSKPDILLVAMGIPRQEKFIAKTNELIGAKVAVGVGGSFDVFSGRAKRAPKLIQKLHLEWLWRTILNPKKMKKASTLPRFVRYVLGEKK